MPTSNPSTMVNFFSLIKQDIPGWFGMLLVVFGGISSVIAFGKARLLNKAKPSNKWVQTSEVKYSLFISTAMSSLSPNDYVQHRNNINSFIGKLKNHGRYKSIYFSGETISTQSDFIAPDLAIQQDFGALESSSLYVLILPEVSKTTSAIVEAGYALALGKPCVFFVKDELELPFMLRKVQQINNARVKVYNEINFDKIYNILTNPTFSA